MWQTTREADDDRSPEERHAEMILALSVVALRACNLAIATSGVLAGWRRIRRRKLVVMTLAGAIAEAVWLARRTWPERSLNDRQVVFADCAFVAGLIWTRRLFEGDEPDPDLGWIFEYSHSGITAAGMGLGATPEGAAAAGIIFASHVLSRTDPADRAAGIAHPGIFAASAHAGNEMRKGAKALGASRRLAMESGHEAASHAERLDQHRMLHDNAVQTLEAAARAWTVDDDAMRIRAGMDADRLRASLDRETLAASSAERLDGELRSVLRQSEGLGLEIDLVIDPTASSLAGPACTTVVDGVREALVNVRKHAGVNRASVTIACQSGRLLATVRDDGGGFDPARVTRGFGLRNSMSAPVRRIGGQLQVDSQPGAGTTVRMHVPIDAAPVS